MATRRLPLVLVGGNAFVLKPTEEPLAIRRFYAYKRSRTVSPRTAKLSSESGSDVGSCLFSYVGVASIAFDGSTVSSKVAMRAEADSQ